MGLDYEKDRFTSEPHIMLPIQVARLAFELEPGDSTVVRNDAVWVDRTYNRDIWIDGYTEALSDDQVISNGESDPYMYARLHCVRKGLVLNNSHLELRSWSWDKGIYLRRELHDDRDVLPMPIIHCIFNGDELDLARRALKKNGIKLNKLNTIPDLMQAIDDAVEIDDDIAIEEADGEDDE